MKIKFLPRGKIGKWSTWLLIMSVSFYLTYEVIEGYVANSENGLLTVPIMVILVIFAKFFGIATGVTGFIASIKYKEITLVASLSIAIGVVSIVFFTFFIVVSIIAG